MKNSDGNPLSCTAALALLALMLPWMVGWLTRYVVWAFRVAMGWPADF